MLRELTPLIATSFTLIQFTIMGLLDFLNNEGDKKPAETPAPAAGGTNFFGNDKPADASAGTTYTVVSGDTLSKIARNHYGDGTKWHQLYEANKATIGSNPDNIEVGQVLTLPSL